MEIRSYRAADEASVVRLWTECGLVRPWNDPHKDILRKLTVQPELFLVGVLELALVATVMAGFDGHRGWANYLAVAPDCRRRGFGRQLMHRVEARLKDMGCPKLNIQVRTGNEAVLAFYERLGYAPDRTVSLGKRLIPDE
ncbi:MAG TPA: GNAT family acetyltransferase [Burkholderiales bacterium]|nr:GNAT family acetyltransferase [Burkholderiales bacterium]